MRPAVLVMAKAPVPGEVKTRLGAEIGLHAAAALAAACVLDTLEVCAQVFDERHVALAGDLDRALDGAAIRTALEGWTVHEQRGDGFAERLAHAHADASVAGRAVVQIGMDTPHVSARHLADVADQVAGGERAVLGPAEDGGWWVLAVDHPALAAPLAGVEMSTERTYDDTLAALRAAGTSVAGTATLRDVDTVEDADHAAAAAPHTRFARLWSQVRS